MFVAVASAEYSEQVEVLDKIIAQNLPSAGIEVGQKGAKARSTTQPIQIDCEIIRCGPSMK